MIFILLIAQLSFASSVVWELPLDSAEPRAVLFEPNSAAIYLSLQSGEAAGLVKIALDGKIIDRSFAVARGEAGPLRAFDDHLYWVGGEKVWKVPLQGGKQKTALMNAPDNVNDIAVDKDGTVYLATNFGIEGAKITDKKVTGLFILDRILYFLEEGNLREFSLKDRKIKGKKTKFCSSCAGLERNSAGDWISVEAGKIILVKGKKKTAFSTGTGRIAYVFQMDTKNDFLVVPRKNSISAERLPSPR